MQNKQNIIEFLRENKTVVLILAVCLFLIELEVFALSVMKSGRKSRLHVLNTAGEMIYETDGNNLSSFDKYYFEKTFGPFENYNVKLVTTEQPFPFRAWFSAAIGIPVGLVLLMAFVSRRFPPFFMESSRRPAAPMNYRVRKPGLKKLYCGSAGSIFSSSGFLYFC